MDLCIIEAEKEINCLLTEQNFRRALTTAGGGVVQPGRNRHRVHQARPLRRLLQRRVCPGKWKIPEDWEKKGIIKKNGLLLEV